MTQQLFLAFCTFAFVSSITPGPNNLMLMASGTNFGFRRTLPHMLGVTIGFMLLCAVVGLGLGQIVSRYPLVQTVMTWASIGYLLYLAWCIATAAPPDVDAKAGAVAARPFSFLQAVLFQWINPKGWTMALTAMAVYAPADDPVNGALMVAVLFGVVNMPSVAVWVVLGVQARRFLASPARLRAFNICAAVLLVASIVPAALDAASGLRV